MVAIAPSTRAGWRGGYGMMWRLPHFDEGWVARRLREGGASAVDEGGCRSGCGRVAS